MERSGIEVRSTAGRQEKGVSPRPRWSGAESRCAARLDGRKRA
nr:hypothetical protein [Mediterraneibacter glycyrrhizinilyticus]